MSRRSKQKQRLWDKIEKSGSNLAASFRIYIFAVTVHKNMKIDSQSN